MTDDERRREIRWAQENEHPHGCGNRIPGPLCDQELDGRCFNPDCAYYGLTASDDA